jgi:hypothetical protein
VKRAAVLVNAAALVFCISCAAGSSGAPPEKQQGVGWHPLGTWSGEGTTQTGSFVSDTGLLRVRWKTTNGGPPGASGKTTNAAPGASGTFRLTLHSAVSGRTVTSLVDVRGAGEGIASVGDDTNVYYVLTESEGLRWWFTVEEGIAGR